MPYSCKARRLIEGSRIPAVTAKAVGAPTLIRRFVRRSLIMGCGVFAFAGCAYGPPPAARFYPPQELADLVTGHTLHVAATTGPGPNMLIYLAPDGTGWLDAQFGQDGQTHIGSMSMLSNWYIAAGSQVCATASPRIGEMPDFGPAKLVCVQVLRPSAHVASPAAVVCPDGRCQELPVAIYPFDAFPEAKVAQYRLQVSVLFGNHIPTWLLP